MSRCAGIGVVITLIGSGVTSGTDPAARALSTRVRDAILQSLVTDAASDGAAAHTSASHASALRAALGSDATGLTRGEALLLDELLVRISSIPRGRTLE